MVVLFFAIPAVVLLGSALLLAASRRNEAMKVEGQLSRETRQRDLEAQETASAESEPVAISGRDIEKAAVLERAGGTELEIPETAAPVPWTAPDEEAVGVARRQFLNRSIVGLAFLWGGGGSGGFGSKIKVGNVTDIQARIDAANGFLYVPEGRMWVTKYPGGSIKKA